PSPGRTIRIKNIPPLPTTPTRKPVPPPMSPGTAAKIPLPPSPEKTRQAPPPSSPTRAAPSVPFAPNKPLPSPNASKPLAFEFDDFLQQSIASDMEALQLSSPQPKLQQRSPAPQPASSKMMNIPPIPPFQGHPRPSTAERVSTPSTEKPLPVLAQQPLPPFMPNTPSTQQSRHQTQAGPVRQNQQAPQTRQQQQQPSKAREDQSSRMTSSSSTATTMTAANFPIPPTSSTATPTHASFPTPANFPTPPVSSTRDFVKPVAPSVASAPTNPPSQLQSSSSSSRTSTSNSSGRHPSPPTEITALSSVVIPALEAALHRRTYNLNTLHAAKSASSTHGSSNKSHHSQTSTAAAISPKQSTEQLAAQQRRLQAHEHIRRLVAKAGRVFAEIDRWDGEEPVGMGEEVQGFLEGFLEEVLVRVETVEEY
ncbi:hypothetical protein LTS18_008907, partial [Coniosporium uncinatum]